MIEITVKPLEDPDGLWKLFNGLMNTSENCVLLMSSHHIFLFNCAVFDCVIDVCVHVCLHE